MEVENTKPKHNYNISVIYSNIQCYVNRYKIPFIVADNTYSLEFMMFEKRATELIGKSAETLHKYHDPATIPSDISQWIGHKFTFVVRVLYKKSIRTKDPSFEVLFIKERHGKQKVLPSYDNQSSGTSTTSDEIKGLPALMTISSKKPTDEVSFYTNQ
jgi:replication factor A1